MRTATPNRLILQPLDATDPRRSLDQRALVEASENAFPIVARRQARRDTGGLAIGAAVALVLGGLTFWSMAGRRAVPPVRVALPAPAGSPVFHAPPAALTAPAPAPAPLRLPRVSSPTPTLATPAPAGAPVVVFDASGASAPGLAVALPDTTSGAAGTRAPSLPGGSDADQFAARVGNAQVDVATAQRMTSPATTVTQGTLIPAVLETAIDTDLPGYVRAVVSRDVRSFDGSRVVIPRSSRLIGQYKSGLAAGQRRAYIIWSRLIRPDGASVALASPAVAFDGTSGLGGKVDSHFMQRFGAAALLTVIGGLPGLIGNPSVIVAGGQGAAGAAVQGNGAIPPTIRVAQGQPIRVFTARDLDFSTVGEGAAQ